MEQQRLVVSESREVAPAPATDILAIIARAASDPSVDPAKMQALLDVQERILDKRAEIAFNEAMVRLQPNLPRITKDGVIYAKDGVTVRSKFTKFETLDRVLRPLYTAEGFGVTFTTDLKGEMLFVTASVRHCMGHKETTTVPVPIDKNAYRTEAQNMGSTISYGKRYAFCAAFNIVTLDEDDDGQGGSTPISLDQLNQIEDLILDTGANRAKFMEWIGVTDLKNLPTSKYEQAVAALKGRKKR